MVTSAEKPHNHPIYSLDTEIGSAIFFTEGYEDSSCFQNFSFMPTQEELEGVWEESFDGSAYREGAWVRVWMRPPRIKALSYSYELAFDCMSNEAKYEAMILEILVLKKLRAKRVVLHGDFELIIKKMTGEY